jgi:hypothetical protein
MDVLKFEFLRRTAMKKGANNVQFLLTSPSPATEMNADLIRQDLREHRAVSNFWVV